VALHRLTRIEVGVTDLEPAIEFYSDFGLQHLGEGRFATADGGEQLWLVAGTRRRLREIGIGCDDADDLERAAHDLGAAGFAFTRDDADVLVTDPGSGVTARITIAARYDQQLLEAPATNGPGWTDRPDLPAPGGRRDGAVRPRKLGHVVLGSVDVEASERLFVDTLGFRVSDTVSGVGSFVRCSEDHHNLMVSRSPEQFLHHTSWQVDDVDEVGRGAASMVRTDRTRHVWGLGRHNIGSNFFYYLRDPSGNLAEYYSDLDIITEALKWEPGVWGPFDGSHAWGPRTPKGFYSPDDVAALMMEGD
jgi:catechol 2,3-dioxygenase-like lactoylglutathione lyase family enzyme